MSSAAVQSPVGSLDGLEVVWEVAATPRQQHAKRSVSAHLVAQEDSAEGTVVATEAMAASAVVAVAVDSEAAVVA
jgi:hypothetical protein